MLTIANHSVTKSFGALMALRSKNISAFAEQQTVFRGKTPSLQDVLVDRGDVSPDEMFKAVTLQRFENTKLSDLLQGLGYATEDVILRATSEQSGMPIVDLMIDRPGRIISSHVNPTISLHHSLVPWKFIDDVLVVAVSNPEDIPEILPYIRDFSARFEFVLAPKTAITRYHKLTHRSTLSNSANQYVDEELSCQNWTGKGPRRLGFAL